MEFLTAHAFYDVKIGCRRLGKEDAIVQIALRLKEKICVDEDKLEVFKIMGLRDVFTTDAAESRIHLVNYNLLNKKYLDTENKKGPVIGIILSSLFHGWDNNPYKDSETYGLHVFEYSDHSSYHEILDFIQALKPKKVIPIIPEARGEGFMRTRTTFLKNRIDMAPLQSSCRRFRQNKSMH